jgi:RimJ/RimL family protein N-acetyltransferase
VKLTEYTNAEDFLALVMPLLMAEEAKNSLMLGVCLSIRDFTNKEGPQPYLACVLEGGDILLASVMTPPFPIVLFSPLDTPPVAAHEALIDNLHENDRQIPGARGENGLAKTFADLYAAYSGKTARISMAQRAFKLTEVAQFGMVPGAMRPARAVDLPEMVDMMTNFAIEAIPDDSRDHIEDTVRRFIERGQMFLWEVDGQPVTIAAGTRPTPNSITIGGVYTPPELRRRGYATALVAELSRHYLETGKQFVTLFTDLANPTSNHIYQQIGYRPVGDFSIYAFD